MWGRCFDRFVIWCQRITQPQAATEQNVYFSKVSKSHHKHPIKSLSPQPVAWIIEAFYKQFIYKTLKQDDTISGLCKESFVSWTTKTTLTTHFSRLSRIIQKFCKISKLDHSSTPIQQHSGSLSAFLPRLGFVVKRTFTCLSALWGLWVYMTRRRFLHDRLSALTCKKL